MRVFPFLCTRTSLCLQATSHGILYRCIACASVCIDAHAHCIPAQWPWTRPDIVCRPALVHMCHNRLKFLKAAKKRTHDSGVEHGDDGVGHCHSKRRSMQERRERTSIEQWHEARKSRCAPARARLDADPVGRHCLGTLLARLELNHLPRTMPLPCTRRTPAYWSSGGASMRVAWSLHFLAINACGASESCLSWPRTQDVD